MLLLAPLTFLLALLAGVLLDRCLGEVPRWHPLVGFGRLVQATEARLNRASGGSARRRGQLAWGLMVLPLTAVAGWLCTRPGFELLLHSALLYLGLGGRSLAEHGQRVADDLAAGQLDAARTHLGWIVSRETGQLDAGGVAAATVESLLENGNDALFATLFWFALLGGPGVVLYRLTNTLDAMWGYRTPRFVDFGRAAARIDDALNWLPARLTALSYAACGQARLALTCWQRQAPKCDSPNAGPVMAAGAGALRLRLGGAAIYHGQREYRPALGHGLRPVAGDIGRALQLIRRTLWLWLGLLAGIALLVQAGGGGGT